MPRYQFILLILAMVILALWASSFADDYQFSRKDCVAHAAAVSRSFADYKFMVKSQCD